MDEDLEQFGENANYLFAFVFNVEMVFKLMGLRKIYFMYKSKELALDALGLTDFDP